MQFFVYEIVARIVAIYLCVDCGRGVRYSASIWPRVPRWFTR